MSILDRVTDEFDAEWAHRVAQGRIRDAEAAKVEAEHYAAHPVRRFVKVATRDELVVNDTEIASGIFPPHMLMWREIETRQASQANDVLSSNGESRIQWVNSDEDKEAWQGITKGGHFIVSEAELKQRITKSVRCKESPTLADRVDAGELVITPMSPAECQAHERLLLIKAKQNIPMP